jgi:hypothetical protein
LHAINRKVDAASMENRIRLHRKSGVGQSLSTALSELTCAPSTPGSFAIKEYPWMACIAY